MRTSLTYWRNFRHPVRSIHVALSRPTLREHPALRFWMWAFLLNALLFLPFYLIPVPRISLLPILHVHTWQDVLVRREWGDFFRINAEFVFLLTLWVFSVHRRLGRTRVLSAGLVLFYTLTLIYHIYAAIMIGVYHTSPNLYSDYAFIIGGIHFVLDALHVPFYVYAIAVTALLLLIFIPAVLLRALLRVPRENLGTGTRVLLLSMTVFAVVQGVTYGVALSDPYMEVHSWSAELLSNGRAILQSRRNVADITRYNPYADHNYAGYTLPERPNIYLLFVESYGRILYDDPFYRDTYTSLMEEWENRLTKQGWHMASTLSESPTWGGGSWMAYTSAMFGVHVGDQPEYLALREKYQYAPYPNLGRFLHARGYDYVWVVPIVRELSAKEEEANRRFYGADRWITFEDLDYHGPLYGWGPSPPDQYTLGYIREFARSHQGPLFLFFLTQSSHYPWVPLPPVVEDWHTLASASFEGGSLSPEAQKRLSFTQTRRNYLHAITYDLNMLGDFLLRLEDEHALVILMGDHQPPAVTARSDGYATPVHVLSRDAKWVDRFAGYGFRSGLVLEHPTPTMRHEDLYDMLVHVLAQKKKN